jgi:Fur family ferric uptake transcriptional regulator
MTADEYRSGPSGMASTQGSVDRAMELIRERGGRSTPSRRAVLEALIEVHDDLRTADALVAEIQRRYPSISESTVYRTLDLLAELGVARHVHLGHGPSRWQLRRERPCWYLTCTVCGRVTEFAPDLYDSVVTSVAARTGFIIDAGHFAVTGTCADCAAASP